MGGWDNIQTLFFAPLLSPQGHNHRRPYEVVHQARYIASLRDLPSWAVLRVANLNSRAFYKGLDYRQSCSGNKREQFLLPEQKWVDGNVHARPVGDIF